MKKTICLILAIVLCMSCFSFGVCAVESEEVESGIVDALRAVEPVKEQLELSSVDFEQLATSNHIFAYDYTNSGCVYNAEFIPIKYEGGLIGWVIKVPGDGEDIYQFTTALVDEVNDHLDELGEFAIIYDEQSSYMYNGVDLIKLRDISVAVDDRAEVTEEDLIDVAVVLNSIDANYNLDYTNNASNARTSAIISCNVGYVSQGEESSLCWAASTACIVNYLRGTNYDANIIAMGWYGSTDYGYALPLGQEDDVLAYYNVYYTFRQQKPSEAVILNNIGNGYPVLATFQTEIWIGNHDVVIYGVNPTAGKLYVMDPTIGFVVTSPTAYGEDRYYSAYFGDNLNLRYATCKYWTS